jgi:hypothetical protein
MTPEFQIDPTQKRLQAHSSRKWDRGADKGRRRLRAGCSWDRHSFQMDFVQRMWVAGVGQCSGVRTAGKGLEEGPGCAEGLSLKSWCPLQRWADRAGLWGSCGDYRESVERLSWLSTE